MVHPVASSESMAPHRLGIYWRNEEVECLLETMLDEKAGELVMPSTNRRTIDIFTRVARRLTAEGFPRTVQQCRSKFKILKGSFFSALEKWEGIPPVRRRPPYFKLLFRLWEQAKRPSWLDRRPSILQRHQSERNRAVEEAESEEEVSSTDSQQVEKNTDGETMEDENMEEPTPRSGNAGLSSERAGSCDNSSVDNLQTIKREDETPQMETVLPTKSEAPPLQDNSSTVNFMTIKKEEELELPELEMALPEKSENPFLQGPVMFVSIPCTAAVVSGSAQAEQSHQATQTIPDEDMFRKVEKLELSLQQATAQITRLEQEIAQREDSYRTRIDRLEKDSEKMYQEMRHLWQCLHKFSPPSTERGQL